MLRLGLFLLIAAASVLLLGARDRVFAPDPEEQQKISAACEMVRGSVDRQSEWSRAAAENPMLFIRIEAGQL